MQDTRRILIVDDQNFNIDASKIILKYSIKLCDCNEIIDSALDGQLALDKVKENVLANGNKKCSYGLILMDCNMPHMDGYESTHQIRSFLYSLKLDQPIIVAVTGHSEPEYVARAINSGMNQVLSKPM